MSYHLNCRPPSILEIVINTRPFTFPHTLLLLVHLHNHPTPRRLFNLLILPLLDKAREAQTDPLPTAIGQRVGASLVPRAERQIGRFHLPHETRFEPDIGLVLWNGGVGVEWFRFVNDGRFELVVKVFEDGFGKACADVADSLKGFGGWIVAGEEESAVDGGAFAFAVVRTQHDEVEGVADAGKVVLLHFEPVAGPFARLVAGLVRVEHLHHEAFAGRFDGFVEEGLNFFEVVCIAVLGKGEFAFDFGERSLEEVSSFTERLLDNGLQGD